MNFLKLGVLSYLIGVFFQVNILYKLAYFFLGVHLILKLYHRYIIKNLQVSHSIEDDHIFLNEQIDCQIRVENQGRLPVLWLKIVEGLPRKLSPEEKKDLVFLSPGERKIWGFSLKGRKRGFYQIGSLEWETGDFLGYNLYQGWVEKLSVFVFPRILELEELGLPSRLPFGDIKWPQPIYKDPYQTVGIREYQPVDSLRKIHWKATARTGKLQVRESQSTVSLETAIVLNLSQGDYGLKYLERKVELGITAAASLANYLNKIGQPYSFITNGQNPYLEGNEERKDKIYKHQQGRGEIHLQQILETLVCIEAREKGDLPGLLSKQLDLSWGGTVIIITEEDTDELLQVCTNLNSRGYSVKLILLGRVKHLQYLHRPMTASLSIYQLQRERDIHGFSKL